MAGFFCRSKKKEKRPLLYTQKKKNLYFSTLARPTVAKKIHKIKKLTSLADTSLLIASFFWLFADHYLKKNVPPPAILTYYWTPFLLAITIMLTYSLKTRCQERQSLKEEINNSHLKPKKEFLSTIEDIRKEYPEIDQNLYEKIKKQTEKYFIRESKTHSVENLTSDFIYLMLRASICMVFALIFYTKTDKEEENVYNNIILGTGLFTGFAISLIKTIANFFYER